MRTLQPFSFFVAAGGDGWEALMVLVLCVLGALVAEAKIKETGECGGNALALGKFRLSDLEGTVFAAS